MSFSILIGLLALTAVALLFKRNRLSWLLLGASILFVFGIGQGWLFQIIVPSLDLKPRLSMANWAKENVVVVLGGGLSKWPESELMNSNVWATSRVLEAARLYHECAIPSSALKRSCKLLVSGGDPLSLGQTEAEVMKRELTSLGIPEADILTEDESRNTFQNAKFSREILRRWPEARVYLVTSSLHLKRANLFFRHFGIGAVQAPADAATNIDSWKPLAYTASQTDSALHEAFGILQYHLYNLMGKNPPPIAVIEN